MFPVSARAIDGSRGSTGGSDAHPAASTTQAQASRRIAAWVAAGQGRARGTRPILPPGRAGRNGTKDPWGGGCDLGAIASGRRTGYDGFQEAATETVYIVDDDVAFARGLARVVAAAGWQTEVFSSAADVLANGMTDGGDPGCLLLDVRMPGMRGTDLYRALLDRRIDLPVIFLTGHGDVPTSVDAMKLGAVDFLEKPVRAEQLLAAIRVALARRVADRERDRELRGIESRLGLLSPREREVMGHVVAGRLNKQIAAEMCISVKTVKAHRAKVMAKMDVRSVPALVDLCRAAGL